jgi:hypothetical protein
VDECKPLTLGERERLLPAFESLAVSTAHAFLDQDILRALLAGPYTRSR